MRLALRAVNIVATYAAISTVRVKRLQDAGHVMKSNGQSTTILEITVGETKQMKSGDENSVNKYWQYLRAWRRTNDRRKLRK